MTSEDSQTVLLNSPLSSTTPSPGQEQEKERPTQDDVPSKNNITDPRKCWICFTDETEDTPASSAWRSPCPCALVAHESCLLDWVANLEAPNSRKRAPSDKILCPQCKSEIIVARPRSFVVEAVNAIERVTARMVVPGLLLTVAGTAYAGCFVHGIYTIFAVFGREDAQRILNDAQHVPTWKLLFLVPSIPTLLILSRTRMADNLLPVFPILFYAFEKQRMDSNLWPPSAAMTIAALPYIRAAYNQIYEIVFGEREKRWLREIQPRAGENDAGNPAGVGGGANNGQGEEHQAVLMGLDLEVEVFEEEAEPGPEEIPHPQAPANAADGPANQGAALPNQQQPANVQPLAQNNFIISTNSLADTILGALVFPSVSAAMGALLKVALPHSWTTTSVPSDRFRSGLLQTRWGRTIVGGCLFVVLKDTALLYSRWKIAQSHQKRKVLDYDQTRRRVVDR